MEDFAQLARPLTVLSGKNVPWKWDTEAQDALNRLKSQLTSAPFLDYPDPTQPCILDADTSKEWVGGVVPSTGRTRTSDCIFQQNTLETREELLCYTEGAVGRSQSCQTFSILPLWAVVYHLDG